MSGRIACRIGKYGYTAINVRMNTCIPADTEKHCRCRRYARSLTAHTAVIGRTALL